MTTKAISWLLAVTACTLAAAIAVSGASAESAAPSQLQWRNCGALAAAGKTWLIRAAGISCAGAKGVVRKAAPKAVKQTRTRLLGTYSGMTCSGGKRASTGYGLNCLGGPKAVQAGTR